MDSSPDLSVKLRRGSSDSRDSFYMGFAQGIDSDIEEVTTVQAAPLPPPPLYPDPEEPPIDIPEPVDVPSEPEELVRLPETEVIECDKQEPVEEENVEAENTFLPIEPAQVFFEHIPPPPLMPEDDEDTNTSVTVIQSKNKTPSSSSSSISSALNELAPDDAHRSQSPRVESPRTNTQSIEAEIATRSPSSHKSSPPRRLNLTQERRARNFDSDSIDSINAIDCKIDDDNREDSSPTDSMPPAPTPPPLGFPLSLEKR